MDKQTLIEHNKKLARIYAEAHQEDERQTRGGWGGNLSHVNQAPSSAVKPSPETATEADRGARAVRVAEVISDPARVWAFAMAETHEAGKVIELAIKRHALAVESGDLNFVRESLIGQSMWLQRQAILAAQRAAAVPMGSKSDDKERQWLSLSVKLQQAAARTLASVAALDKLATVE